MNNKTILSAQQLSKSYKTVDNEPLQILDGFDLNIHAGEIVALVGPSGSGKSTLLHILGLLDNPSDGDLFINDKNVSQLSDSERTKIRRQEIGFIYQFHHLLPEFTAMENIALPQMITGTPKKAANEYALKLLKRLRLDHRADNRPAKLSGGEQQRVAIARALANKPSLILADEPTGNLDPETAEEVFQLFMTVVRKTGVAAFIATHNMELAKRMDRIVEF